MLAAGDTPSLYRYISFTHVCSQLKIPEYYDTDSAVCQQIQIFIFRGSDSFMIMSLYTTRDYVPPDFCGILSLMIFYYEEITL